MQVAIDYIKRLISAIGFAPLNGENNIFFKSYASHDHYTIWVDFNENKIAYFTPTTPQEMRIRLGDVTTSNFANAENFVVLECVDRLLEKGYKPSSIELEKKYPLGRNLKGKLDILVYDGCAPFLMIECKTWDAEYQKEYNKMIKDGGQLLSYYAQDRASKYLCLYASRFAKAKTEFKNAIIPVQDAWRELSGTKEIYDYWNKNFKDNGVFEDCSAPYNIKNKALTYGMLKSLKEDDSGKIFNQIMEILRHNAISDKPNAFNKLLNLFVCKIIDEDKNADDELEFQWLETDDNESLQMRLNDLYKDGMWRFLEINVIDHSEDEVSEALQSVGDEKQKQLLKNMFRDARLKKSPNFAFAEVLDNKTFELNAKIVREIVELLQFYKFRYDQKHEFLGNFFELLLNTSMKQEAGQFFTPVPITRFIISSLPLKEFVQKKVDNREHETLPVVMDYACGSGHFLTEYMSQLQRIINEKIDVSKASPETRRNVQSWQGLTNFLWAKDFVYGIDLDNRLVKTTKVSAFFNGDGEANIIWANGLDNFVKSEEYRGKLRQVSAADSKNNGQFDILMSNPPYSVEAFKSMLKFGGETFDLYDSVTDNSKEIECLFVERMKQLLKEGGWAGVILPSSILSNGGLHSKAREIIFKHFNVKALVELGSGTFMKTGTNTVILFLERRSDNDCALIERAIHTFFSNKKDVTVAGIENAFSKYVADAYDDISFDDYVSFLNGKATDIMVKHELFVDYKKAFGDDVYTKGISVEKEKLLYFLLTYSQNIVIVKTGKKDEEKKFLGYEFSERRGHEGIKWLSGGTALYDENDALNPQKANSYIYNAFLGKKIEIDESLTGNVSYGRMSGFISYGTSKFDKLVNLNKRVKYDCETKWDKVTIKDISKTITKGTTPTTIGFEFLDTGINFVKIENINTSGEIENLSSYISKECNNRMERSELKEGDFLLSIAGSFGRVAQVSKNILPANTNQALAIIRGLSDKVNSKYFFEILRSSVVYLQVDSLIKGVAQYNLSLEQLKNIKVPLPPLDVQQKIVAEIQGVETKETICIKKIESFQGMVLRDDYFSFETQRIGDVALMIKRGKSAKYGDSEIQIIKSGQARGYREFDFSQRFFVAEGFVSDERNLMKGDVLINSTGVGTAGRVTLFELEGNFVADTHITIVRPNQELVEPKYMLYALVRIGFKNIEAMANGQSGQIELSSETIKEIRIPIPPINKQKEIVAEIERNELEVEKLKKHLLELKVLKDGVLKKYL